MTATKQQRNNSTAQPSKLSGEVQWNVKSDDFFPYSDCPHCFWTGYFTSRTAFKRFERVASSFLLAARQIEALPPVPESVLSSPTGRPLATSSSNDTSSCIYDCDRPLFPLEDALGVVQHHDAVSGTAKQHVADDYSKRLQAGLDAAAKFVASKLRQTMVGSDHDLEDFAYCQLVNETVCQVSEVSIRNLMNAVLVQALLLLFIFSNDRSISIHRPPRNLLGQSCTWLFTIRWRRIDLLL